MDAKKAIMKSRVRMLMNMPFFGTLAIRLELVDASNWLPTLATDGKRFYYNKDFVAKLSKEELDFGVAHEVMHCVYMHMDRRGSRDPRLWNVAADYVINLELTDAGFTKITTVDILHDEKYRDMSSDEVYEKLMEEQEKHKDKNSFDEHMAPGSGKGDQTDPSGKNGPVPMTQEEFDELEDEVKQAVIDAAKNLDPNSHGKGLPGRVKRFMKELNDPTIPWNEILNKTIKSLVQADYTWSRPNRKSPVGIVLPSTNTEQQISIAVGIDTSGSISEDMFRDFLSEVYGIMQEFNAYEIYFFCWDTECYTMHRFDETNGEDILDVEFEGCGGNNGIEFIWEFMEEHNVTPEHFINFTDGYIFGSWGDEPEFPVTTVLWGDDNNNDCPFGENIKYTGSHRAN